VCWEASTASVLSFGKCLFSVHVCCEASMVSVVAFGWEESIYLIQRVY
jgi:hypothetical protein